MISPRKLTTAVVAVALVLAGCSGSDRPTGAGPAAGTSPQSTAAPPTGGIDGKFDVGGHQLHLRCEGTGSPTVIYLHGLSHVDDGGQATGSSAARVPSLVSDTNRFCGYDRANVGSSDRVAGPLTGKSAARDLDALLTAAKIEPPYLLLGASFGGLVAEIYAANHPDQVTGMLLLDAGFPDELKMEALFPKSERLNHEKTGDSGWATTHEQMDELAAYQDAAAVIGKEPKIPMTYLLADPPSYGGGPPGYDDAFPKHLASFAKRYSPGKVLKVRSPHYMEAAIPERIAEEIDKLAAK